LAGCHLSSKNPDEFNVYSALPNLFSQPVMLANVVKPRLLHGGQDVLDLAKNNFSK
jgi:hypothetical protein